MKPEKKTIHEHYFVVVVHRKEFAKEYPEYADEIDIRDEEWNPYNLPQQDFLYAGNEDCENAWVQPLICAERFDNAEEAMKKARQFTCKTHVIEINLTETFHCTIGEKS